jgi:hypothetical protein
MSIRIGIAGLVVSASGLLAASSAKADVTTYAGSVCVQNVKVWNTTGLYFTGPEITTITGSTQINCPIDQHGQNVLAATVSGHVWAGTVSCALYVRDKYNDSSFSAPSVTSTTSPRYTLDLLAAVRGGVFAHFFPDGTKNVICTLPAAIQDYQGTVASITIDEE